MLTVSSKNTTELAKDYTQPIFLLYLGYTTPIRISTKGPTTWNSQTWQDAFLDVGNIQYGDYGDNSAVVRIHPSWLSTLLAQDFADIPAELYQLFGNSPYAVGDGIQLIDGFGSEMQVSRDYIDLTLITTNSRFSQSPRSLYDHQNIQAAGTRVVLGSTTITIERADFI